MEPYDVIVNQPVVIDNVSNLQKMQCVWRNFLMTSPTGDVKHFEGVTPCRFSLRYYLFKLHYVY